MGEDVLGGVNLKLPIFVICIGGVCIDNALENIKNENSVIMYIITYT